MFDDLMSRIAGRFGRVEPRRRARSFVLGLLAELPRKNCWTIAEHAADTSPDRMQHLLDSGAVRDDLRDYIVERLGDPGTDWRAGQCNRLDMMGWRCGVARRRGCNLDDELGFQATSRAVSY
jgi:hypothetical protein